MKLLNLDSDITLTKQTFIVSDIVNSLVKLDASDVVHFLTSVKLNIPRTLRMHISKKLLSSFVKQTKDDRQTLADEFNFRLKWFSEFSDQQFINLLDYYNNKELNQTFAQELMLNILSHCLEAGVSDIHLLELYQASTNKQSEPYNNIKAYNQVLDKIFFDEPSFLDGVPLERVRIVFFKGSTLSELKEIGLKYGVVVPKRLKKAELLESIFQELKLRNEFTQSVADDLTKKTVILIQRFAIDNDIKVSSELKKEQVIEYILEHANQTKELYFKLETNPYDFDLENDEVPLSQEVEIQVEETPAEETVAEETPVEETPVEETPVEETPEEEIEQVVHDVALNPFNAYINALQYKGTQKDFKQQYAFIDPYNVIEVIETKSKAPFEFRFIFGILKLIVLIILQTLALVFSVVFVLAVMVIVYASVMHFAEPEALIPINDWINGFEFLGKGLLDHISGVFERIGL
jgi:hypothetical protein